MTKFEAYKIRLGLDFSVALSSLSDGSSIGIMSAW